MMYARTTNSKCEQKTARKRLMVVDPAKPEKVILILKGSCFIQEHPNDYKWVPEFQIIKVYANYTRSPNSQIG